MDSTRYSIEPIEDADNATMTAAGRLYRRLGFMALPCPLGNTGHSGCDHWYLVDLEAAPV